MRIQLGTASNPSANYCLVYNYYGGTNPTSCAVPTPGTSGNNGNVAGYWYNDGVNASLSHTASHSYDALNRLGSSVATGSSPYNSTFIYDRWGNMTCSGSGSCPSMSYNTSTNRITAIGTATPTYDAAGNLLSDGMGVGSYSYTWDAEGRLTSATTPAGGTSTTTYTYNALGQRVRAAGSGFTYDYVYDPAGEEIGLFNASGGSFLHYTAHIAGRQMLLFPSSARLLYHPNMLGSTAMTTNEAGVVVVDTTFYPWGHTWNDVETGNPGYWTFAAFQPMEPGALLYPTPTRRYAPSQGRWLTPDPENASGDPDDPQSWNMYAYVRNSPGSNVDPTGSYYCSAPGENGVMNCVYNQDYWANPDKYPGYTHYKSNDPNDQELHPPPPEPDSLPASDLFDLLLIAVGGRGFVRGAADLGEVGFSGLKSLLRLGEPAIQTLGVAELKVTAEEVVNRALSAVGNRTIRVASEDVARQAADRFVGPGKEIITDRVTGAFRGWKSADGTRVVIETHSDALGPHMNFHNTLTGGNLHVRW